MSDNMPLIVGIGGALRSGSTSETALRLSLQAIEQLGARTTLFAGAQLDIPHYSPHLKHRSPSASAIIEALRRADAVIISSPGYHGSVSGLIKNALDYVEDMRADSEPYLDGRAVGCIVSAAGGQAAATTLSALRDIVHALRGWPTPLGISLNSSGPLFNEFGRCISETVGTQFNILADHVVGFARYRQSQKSTCRLAS